MILNKLIEMGKKVILFGATGNLGREIAKELVRRGYELTAVVRSKAKANVLTGIAEEIIVAEVCGNAALAQVLDQHQLVISALGKSVSPMDRSKPGFMEVDYGGNMNILNNAVRAGIKKFVYVSAFHSEKYPQLEYFKAHHDFAEQLKKSGMDYSIIKPTAIFSAFTDMMAWAKKGWLVQAGEGDKKTNPIFEGDLAAVVVDSIGLTNSTVEAGGKIIYTRRQLNEIIQNEVNPRKKIRILPVGLLKGILPLLRWVDRNAYHKVAFFLEVMQQDTVAPGLGAMSFEHYVKMKARRMPPPGLSFESSRDRIEHKPGANV
jgi:uncharacterized protein YbjT (DUF2867 family)